jgi:hypothetical protein
VIAIPGFRSLNVSSIPSLSLILCKGSLGLIGSGWTPNSWQRDVNNFSNIGAPLLSLFPGQDKMTRGKIEDGWDKKNRGSNESFRDQKKEEKN